MQKTGETTRDMWHKTDWDKVREDPTSIAFPREDWIHIHDAERHAEAAFDEIFHKYTGGRQQHPRSEHTDVTQNAVTV